MTEAKYEAASKIAKKATALTASIELLEGSKPDQLVLAMAKVKRDAKNTIQIYCMDPGNPTDLVVNIYEMILADLKGERTELEKEFKEL